MLIIGGPCTGPIPTPPPRELTERERLLLAAHWEANNIWASVQPELTSFTPLVGGVVVVEQKQAISRETIRGGKAAAHIGEARGSFFVLISVNYLWNVFLSRQKNTGFHYYTLTHLEAAEWKKASIEWVVTAPGGLQYLIFFLITTPTQGWNNVGSVVGVSQRVCLQRFFRAKAGFVFSTFCKLATSPKRGFVRLTQRRLWQIGLECGAVIWRTFISHTLCSCVALCESGKWQQASVLMAAGEGNLRCLLAPSAGKMWGWKCQKLKNK